MSFYYSNLLASLGLTCATTLALGLLVLLKVQKRRLGLIFFLWCLSIAWWSGLEIVLLTQKDSGHALFWGRVMMAGDVFLPPLFVHVVITLVRISIRWWRLLALYAISAMFSLACATDLIAPSVSGRLTVPNYFIDAGPLYLPMLCFFASCVLFAQFQLYKAYSQASGQNRVKLGYFFWSSVAGFIGGCMNFLLVYAIEVPLLYSFGTYTVPIFVAATSYSIIRYRLMDMTLVMHKGLTYALLLVAILTPAYLALFITQRATIYSLPLLFSGTLISASGLWIILKNPRVTTNVTFGLLCLCASFWLFGFFLIYSTSDAARALFLGKLLHLGIVYIPALFYHFSLSFLEAQHSAKSVRLCYAASTAFLLLLPSDYLISGQHAYFWGYYPQAGMLHPLFLGYFVGIGALALHRLYRGFTARKPASPAEARRLRIVFWAFLLGYASAIDFVQSYGVELYPVGFIFASLWVLLVTYAIAKYQLLDISVIFSKTNFLPYVQGLGIFLSFYALTLFLIRLFTGSTSYLLAAILLASFVVCAEMLVSIQRRMERAVGKALFREKHDAYETLSAFSNDLVTILDLEHLSERFLGVLSRVLNIKTVSLFLLDKEKQVYSLASSQGVEPDTLNSIRLPSSHPLTRKLALTKAPIVREELEHMNPAGDEAVATLNSMQSEACIPLINKERLVGFCNLGPRARREMYSTDDLDLLTTLAQNAAIALDNALLHEDVKKSQLLMRRTDRLRSLETIAGGFAHEIRNPLTSIKTFIQLAPERKDDADFITGFSRVVNDDVHRIERLIEEILDYARYMKPKLSLEDLNDIVSSCLYFVQVKADSLGIGIERELAPRLPYVMLDRQQMKQVLLNLLLNALDAMKEGGGQLTIRTHRLAKPKGQEWVQIEVTDSGPGIEPTNLEHIFDPFYTTKHESGEREGTGLGLAIVHQIVQEHHGTIEVSSQTGRGTTFFVNLPASSRVTQSSEEQEEHEKAGPVGR